MKVGSIKDGRFEGAVSVRALMSSTPTSWRSAPAEAPSFLVVNGTTRARPTIVARAPGGWCAAASVAVSTTTSRFRGVNPCRRTRGPHGALRRGASPVIAETAAPRSDPRSRRCPAIDATDANEPRRRAKCQTRGLAVSRTCVPRDREARPRMAGSPPPPRMAGRQRWWPWLGRSRVVRAEGRGETAAATVKNEL